MTTGAALHRAQALLNLGRVTEARTLLRRSLAEDPSSYQVLCLLALAEYRAGDPAAAREIAGRAVAVNPDRDWAYRLLSLAYIDLHNGPRAVEAAQQAVRMAPESWQTYYTLALAHIEAQDYVAALQVADIAIERAPEEAETHFVRGLAALKAGNRELAQADFERTLSLQPDHAVALNNLGKLSIDRGGLLTAADRLSSALSADPQFVVARHNVDVVAYRALRRFHWAVFVVFLALRPLLSWSPAGGAHGRRLTQTIAAVTALAVLAGAAVVIDRKLPANLRTYFRRLPRSDRWLGAWLAVDVLALLLIAAMALPVSGSAMAACFGFAWLCLVFGMFISRGAAARLRRATQR